MYKNAGAETTRADETKNPAFGRGRVFQSHLRLGFFVQSGDVTQFSKNTASLRALRVHLSEWFLVVLLIDVHLLSDREEVEHEIVQIQT